ncbi:hypothetical protein HGRIS_010792 [Hohenbuehelia grisea]|uniref:rRNA methyltransferase 2, mitochondrial n=1 Tax=Hohenbuehelia grisea TaxID=104357 RepID=A0ABR3IXT2_9AGAR
MAFRQSVPLWKSVTPSSRAWIARQYRDPYVRNRLSDPAAYRSRSAFKLLEIDEAFSFLTKPHVQSVVDLGAAPGGWSQVVAGKLGWTVDSLDALPSTSIDPLSAEEPSNSATWSELSSDVGRGQAEITDPEESVRIPARWTKKRAPKVLKPQEVLHSYDPLGIDDEVYEGRGNIVAVDLLNMQPIRGVHTLQHDFLSSRAEALIKSLLTVRENPEGRADIILSDMAANMTGNTTRDTESSLEICEAVFAFAHRNIRSAASIGKRRGGTLLIKHFVHPLLQDFREKYLERNFYDVKYIKPKASRSESSEAYWLCQGWKGRR